ncbi:MAG: cytidine deaminase [Sphingobacteriia bacterium 35-40-5]|nr:MAG: cytidine deaminase [Sphingobacteriia bacterium 35-40-5]HQR94388.1 dCMP deaminase family protein [Sediminibacterium sp.]
MKKRNDYISWDEYFMGVAILSAKRSKDPNTQVGACIVNKKNRIVGTGYNGLPAGCSDDDFPWDKQGEFLETKYPYVCHAELNAILNNIGMDLAGCRIYTALFPCNECSKAIIQSGISEVVYLSDKYEATDTAKASKRMLENAAVVCRKVVTSIKHLQISFEEKDV